MNTIIYLVKHAEELEEKGLRNGNETTQCINEKYILSIKGEEQSKKLSQNKELQNIDMLWSSNYARAKGTAKYIAYQNNLILNIDAQLNERKLGNLEELKTWMKNKKHNIVEEYLLYQTKKFTNGESCIEAKKRITDFLNVILKENNGKRICIVTHGAILSFLLTN